MKHCFHHRYQKPVARFILFLFFVLALSQFADLHSTWIGADERTELNGAINALAQIIGFGWALCLIKAADLVVIAVFFRCWQKAQNHFDMHIFVCLGVLVVVHVWVITNNYIG